MRKIAKVKGNKVILDTNKDTRFPAGSSGFLHKTKIPVQILYEVNYGKFTVLGIYNKNGQNL